MKKTKDSLKQLFSTLKWVFGLYFKNYPQLTLIYITTQIVLGLSNIVNAYILALVTDKAIDIFNQGKVNTIESLVPIILIIILSQLFFGVVGIFNNYAIRMINNQDYWVIMTLLHKRLINLGIPQLENPEVTNKTQRFSEEVNNITTFMQTAVDIISNSVSFASSLVVVAIRIPQIIPIFTVILFMQAFINRKYNRMLWLLNRNSTEERRKAIYNSGRLADPKDLKELIITGGHQYLSDLYNNFTFWRYQETKKIRLKWMRFLFINRIADAIGFGYGLFLVLQRLSERIITVGQLTFEFRSLGIFSGTFNAIISSFVNLSETAIKLDDSRELFYKYKPEKDGLDILKQDNPTVEFKNVYFSYPDSKKNVIENFNLRIKSGEKVAIIGENGAGKTTLVKLICRLYRLNKGEILIGNKNINNLKIDSWYKNLGVLFQDYNTYSHLNVEENILIGDINKKPQHDKIKEALIKANADDFVNEYPNKLNQILSERFKGGIRPSTGQWQKIAIARFFYRDAPVLILDEPTASIDAVAEAQIFDNIYKFIKNKTVIIISHRFSTVRNADRIIVLDKGRIIEDGTHEELLEKGGKYAKAFKLQAKGYN